MLLIDDDDACLFLHKLVLEEAQLASAIDAVSSGHEALAYLSKVCVQTSHGRDCSCPDLVLLDINMPVVNGFEFLEFCQVMGLLVGKQIKIIVVTSSENELDKQKAREYDVDGYLVKPLTEEKLQEVLLT